MSAGLNMNDLMLIEQRVTNESKSATVAFLLWFFLGVLSGHRFYLGRPGTAILQVCLNIVLIGLIWTLVDAFLIPGMIRDGQAAVRGRLIRQARTGAVRV